jgi:hypothetical protein
MSKEENTEHLINSLTWLGESISEPLPPFPKPKWYDSVAKWELHLLAWKKGVISERERIIKLLEPLGCEANGVEHDCQNGLGYTRAADLIALIKEDK